MRARVRSRTRKEVRKTVNQRAKSQVSAACAAHNVPKWRITASLFQKFKDTHLRTPDRAVLKLV